jgi:hypothetical protein
MEKMLARLLLGAAVDVRSVGGSRRSQIEIIMGL